MILAIDVDYDNDTNEAWVSGVMFDDIAASTGTVYHSYLEKVVEYIPGEFVKREMPCIQKIIAEHSLKPSIIIVDGYCHFDGQPRLGEHLHNAYPEIAVIGVAKNPLKNKDEGYNVYRGDSARPLYVTASGMDSEEAKGLISNMHGKYRHPTILKLVDQMCRTRQA